MKNMDELLKNALTPINEPSEKLNSQILSNIKEKEDMKNRYHKRKLSVAVCMAACVLVMGSVTAIAAYRYLSPKDVAVQLQNNKLEQAFQSEDAIYVNATQEQGAYRITLLGSVAGENISSYLACDESNVVEADKIYTVLAIEHTDGTPMPDTSSEVYGEETFFVSHYVQGLNPIEYNIMSMGGGGYTEFVEAGIQYRLMEMQNIEMFADREIYVGINSGMFYDARAYCYDETSGKLTRNESYEGLNVLFTLPMDKSKANPEAAKEYLSRMEQQSESIEQSTEEKDLQQLTVETFVEKLTNENFNEYVKPIESTRQVCKADKDGLIHMEYTLEDGAGTQGSYYVGDVEELKKVGVIHITGYSCSDGLEDLRIDTLMLNEDGTYTSVAYEVK